ncbi:MAG: diadenylate cyclase CdaA [Deltaproteobacteria bacterium]
MIALLHFWRPVFEILTLWFVIYHMLLFFEGTRAIQVLRGIIILLIIFFLSQRLGLSVLDWLMTKLFAISVIGILIIFAPEIRQGLARLGQQHLFMTTLPVAELESVIKEILDAAEAMSKQKTGALIAIENKENLAQYTESGVKTDARCSTELIQTIFTPNSLLHDGGMIIQHGRISAAGCIFPLTQKQELSRSFGTRHRAALGLSEETDAVIIVVSEERHEISIVYRSVLYKDMDRDEMFVRIKGFFSLRKGGVYGQG